MEGTREEGLRKIEWKRRSWERACRDPTGPCSPYTTRWVTYDKWYRSGSHCESPRCYSLADVTSSSAPEDVWTARDLLVSLAWMWFYRSKSAAFEYSLAVPSAWDFWLLAVADPITILVAGRFSETRHSPRAESGKEVVSVVEDICEKWTRHMIWWPLV